MMTLLERITAFFRAIIGLFRPQTSTDSLSVSTVGDLGPMGQFILSLTCNETARNEWLTNRQQSIANSGLSAQDQQLLTSGTVTAIASQIVAESGGSGSRLWICVWIR